MDLQKIYSDSDFQNAVVPEGQILVFNGLEDGKVVTRYKDSSGKFGTIAGNGGGGSVDVILGQVDADGNFQSLAFNGTEASADGEPETVESYYGWNGVLPVPESGGATGCDFYKCASVDTVNKTWTGYKAVLTDGVYTFDDTAIAGLTFGAAFIPAVGSIYNADATVAVSGLWQGRDPALLFYAPLTSAAATAETGQTLTVSGDVRYISQNGRACAYFPGSSANITANIEGFPISGLDITIAAWLLFTQPNSALDKLVSFGGYQSIMEYDGALRWQYDSGNYIQKDGAANDENWHFVAVTAGSGKLCLYIDGVLSVTQDRNMVSDGVSPLTIGGGSGAVRDLYVYNRCLSAVEIAELYNK